MQLSPQLVAVVSVSALVKRAWNVVFLPLALAVSACHHGGPAVRDAISSAATTPSAFTRLPLAGLRDVACAAPSGPCLALTERGVFHLHGGALPGSAVGEAADATILPGTEAARGFDTLVATDGGWLVEGTCPEGRCRAVFTVEPPAFGVAAPIAVPTPLLEEDAPSLTDQAQTFAPLWNAVIAHHWRVPFVRTVFTPTGGPIALLRGVNGQGQLMRAGSPPRLAPLPISPSPATWPAGLALHPSGGEMYVLLWPTAAFRAVDPLSLAVRWTAPLEGAGQGLFIDPAGRFVLVAEGPGGTERYVDWSLDTPNLSGATDPSVDERLRVQDRPPQSAAAVVDLATHAVVARAPGRYRRWTAVPGASAALFLLATDREILVFQPLEPPT